MAMAQKQINHKGRYSHKSETLQNRPKVRKKRVIRRYKVGPVLKYVGEDKAMFSFHTVFTMALIFIFALGFALSFALIESKNNKITVLQNQLRKQEETNALLNSDIAKKLDLEEIRKIAVAKLGMNEPKAYQVVHIHVPKQNYVVQQFDGQDIQDEENAILGFGKWIQRIFVQIVKR